jgi:hypothetical protein
MKTRIANRLYGFLGWAIVALGGLHMVATIRLSASTPAFRVWFFGSGLAIALGGALNLLNRAYGPSARGLRIVCRIANICLLLLGAVAGSVTGASVVEYVVIMGLLGGAFILSLNRSSLNPQQNSEQN